MRSTLQAQPGGKTRQIAPEVRGFWTAAVDAGTVGPVTDVTRILEAIQRGDSQAAEELLPLVYDELRRLAARKLAGEDPGQTLQPTALVHEAWLRLLGPEGDSRS